jgi:phosphatidylglycerophosphate synthase
MGRDGDSPVVRLVARRVSRALTRWLLPTRIKPNHITLASGLIGVCGALLLAQPARSSQVLGSLLFLLSTIIDGCDGELARLTFQESAFGAKLDVTMDNVVHAVLFPAIALGQYRQHQDALYLILGALALGGVAISMLVFLPHVLRPQTTQSPTTRWHESLASRDFAYLLPILAALQKLPWFLWAAAIGTYVFAAAWVVISWRQRRLGLQR